MMKQMFKPAIAALAAAGAVAALVTPALAQRDPAYENARAAGLIKYDELIIVGPVFPHEVIGFSGGNKYIFPGISGPEILHFFHWLGAVITNPRIIGNKWTPVR